MRNQGLLCDDNISVDGNWSALEWTGEQIPIATCGVVTRKYIRHCNNPPPYNGGEPCDGDRNVYKDIDIGPCPGKCRQ